MSSRCITTSRAHKPLTCTNVSGQSSWSLTSPCGQPEQPRRQLVRTRPRRATYRCMCGAWSSHGKSTFRVARRIRASTEDGTTLHLPRRGQCRRPEHDEPRVVPPPVPGGMPEDIATRSGPAAGSTGTVIGQAAVLLVGMRSPKALLTTMGREVAVSTVPVRPR
jgi:hypothetical protein